MNKIIQKFEAENLKQKTQIPNFKSGDTLRIKLKFQEGKNTRSQIFEGVCISRIGNSLKEMFTVRKIIGNFGVEKTFPMCSKTIEEITIVKTGKSRKANIEYVRNMSAKKIKRVA